MDGAPILNGGENAALYRFWVGSFSNRQSYPFKDSEVQRFRVQRLVINRKSELKKLLPDRKHQYLLQLRQLGSSSKFA